MKFEQPRRIAIDLDRAYRSRVAALAVHDAVQEFAPDHGYRTYTDHDQVYTVPNTSRRPDWHRPTVYIGMQRQDYMEMDGFEVAVSLDWEETVDRITLDALEPDIPERRVSYPPDDEMETFVTVLGDTLDYWTEQDLPRR